MKLQVRAQTRRVDEWHRRRKPVAVGYAVVKKFSDDSANLLVVALAWYGFTAIFPLLLVVVTVFGFVGADTVGSNILQTLHQFPIIGSSFNPASSTALHGSTVGLVIGLVGLTYGAQGVTQTAQQAMASIWGIPQTQRPGFLPRLGRSLLGLLTIGGCFLINAFVSTYATGGTGNYAVRVPVIAGLLLLNTGFYLLSFDILTAKVVRPRRLLLPGAVAGAVAFTLLITVGTGLVTHQLKHTSATYGAFGSVIGIVAFLLLLAKLSLYAAELNPVLAHGLYPRALPLGGPPTAADERMLADLAHAERRRDDQAIGVGFGADAVADAHDDAIRQRQDYERREKVDRDQPGHR